MRKLCGLNSDRCVQPTSVQARGNQSSPSKPFSHLPVIVLVLAAIGLSSCIGYAGAPGGTKPGTSSAGVLSPSTNNGSFGNVSVGSTATQSLTITNTGNATVNISQATISGTGYTVVGGNPSSSIPVGQSSTVQIQFAPLATGVLTGTLTVVSDASNSPLTISMTGTGTQPNLTTSPASISLGSVTVGQTSTQSVKLTNSGNVNLAINLAQVSGSGFGMSGLTTPMTLGAGQSTSFNVQFTPSVAGGATGSIAFTDNAPGSPQALALSGSGVAANAMLTTNPGSVAFGNVVVASNSSQTITLMNSGTASVTISQASVSGTGFNISGISTPLTLSAGQSTSFSAQFAPTTTGNSSATVTVTSNASNPTLTIALSGTGTQGHLSANPANVNFGNVLVGGSGSVSITLTNSGTASVTISAASASGTGFTISGLAVPQTINPNSSTSLTVKFAPTLAGNASGNISITDNAPGSPLSIALSGSATATQPQLTISPSSVSFGNVNVGSSGTQNITLTNAGTAALTISAASASGAGFSISGLTVPVTINPGLNTTLTANFAPAVVGSASGSISITSTAPGSPATIALSGSGVQAQLSANPASISFGNVNVGSNGSQTITLTNSGTASVTISAATASGTGFGMSGITAPLTINAGQNTTLSATFAPTSAGSASGSISITSNAPGSPLAIPLSGTGTQAQLAPTPSSVSFGSVVTGSTNSQTISLKNSGTASITISQANVTGTGFTISGLSIPATIAAGASTTFSAAFTPSTTGSVSGSVSLVSNGPSSPLAIPLTGTGTQGQLSGNPSSVNFGNIVVGSNGSQTITLTNSGTASVTISAATASGTGFSMSGITTPLTINAGQNTTLSATFAPTSAGSASGSISITSNAPGSPLAIPLSG
ncbi:MAG: choice-of-anchor D domain-containing protein, partial [Candidatus Acidiferrales bacterium]